MKHIGIISDTHSCIDARYGLHFEGCDEIWHAGDIGDIGVLEYLRSLCPVVRAVRGNVDHGIVARECPETLDFEVEGLRVFITHIGGYPGRWQPVVKAAIRESHPGLIITGHSHILKVMPDPASGALHINPGAAGQQGWHKTRTIIKLDIDNGIPKDLQVIELSRQVLSV